MGIETRADKVRRSALIAEAVRSPDLLRVVGAYFVFRAAESATWISILVWAFEHGGLRTSSLVALALLVPSAALAPALAAWTARHRAKSALVAGYAAQSLAFGAVAAALLAGAPPAAVIGLAGLACVTVTLTRPVHNAILPRISLTTDELTLGNAASGMAEASAVIVGPLLCAVLIVPSGPGGVYVTMGALSAAGAVAVSRVRRDHGAAPGTRTKSPWRAMRDLAGHPTSRLSNGLVAADNLLAGMKDLLVISLATELLKLPSSGPPLLSSAIGAGALLGALAAMLVPTGARVAPRLLLGAVAAGVAFASTAGASGVWTAALALAVYGTGRALFDIARKTLVQRTLPEPLLTAGFGMMEAVKMAGIALGALLAPPVVHFVGTTGAFVLAGLLLPFTSLAMARLANRVDAAARVPTDVVDLLMGVPFLCVLAPRVVDRLAIESRHQVVPSGTVVVSEGGTGETFYVIRSGRAVVTQGDDEVRELGPGMWFGELALLRDTPRTATVIALGELEVQVLDREHFLAFVAHVPMAVQRGDEHASRTYR